jgi:hypothetical protein
MDTLPANLAATKWDHGSVANSTQNNHTPIRGLNITFLDLHGRWTVGMQRMIPEQRRIYSNGYQHWEDE